MKTLKIALIGFIIFMIFYVVFNKSEKFSLEGKWKATSIVIDGRDLIASQKINPYFEVGNEAVFNYWTDSLMISTLEIDDSKAKFILEKDLENKFKIKLTSKEAALNGDFIMEVDTTHIGPQEYIVELKIYLNKTILHFKREINIPPWKPEAPRKGQV